MKSRKRKEAKTTFRTFAILFICVRNRFFFFFFTEVKKTESMLLALFEKYFLHCVKSS
jgi:hypothetical protein